MEKENIYDKIKEIFGQVPGSFSILEEQIDIAFTAIQFLVDKGFLQSIEQGDGGQYYRVNPVRLSDIHRTLSDLDGHPSSQPSDAMATRKLG